MMNAEQKNRFATDAVRDTAIVDRVGEFRKFCDRYYAMTKNNDFRKFLAEQVHLLESKASELRMGMRPGAVPGAAPGPVAAADEFETMRATAVNLLSNFIGAAASIRIEAGRYKRDGTAWLDLVAVNNALIDIERAEKHLNPNATPAERERALLDPVNNFFNIASRNIDNETEIRNSLTTILRTLHEYATFVEGLVVRGSSFKWWRFVNKYLGPRGVADEFINFYRELATLYSISVTEKKSQLLAKIEQLRQFSAGEGYFNIKNRTITERILWESADSIRKIFDDGISEHPLDYNALASDPRKLTIANIKVAEIEKLREISEILEKLKRKADVVEKIRKARP